MSLTCVSKKEARSHWTKRNKLRVAVLEVGRDVDQKGARSEGGRRACLPSAAWRKQDLHNVKSACRRARCLLSLLCSLNRVRSRAARVTWASRTGQSLAWGTYSLHARPPGVSTWTTLCGSEWPEPWGQCVGGSERHFPSGPPNSPESHLLSEAQGCCGSAFCFLVWRFGITCWQDEGEKAGKEDDAKREENALYSLMLYTVCCLSFHFFALFRSFF